MQLSTIVKKLFLLSGQYIVCPDLSSVRLNMDAIWLALESEFKNYQKYCPLTKRINVNVGNVYNPFMYDFTTDVNNIGYDPQEVFTQDFGSKTFTTGAGSITLALSKKPLLAGSITLSFAGSQVATDDGLGNLVFGGGSHYSGTINYGTGVITLNWTGLGSPSTVDVSVTALWVDYGVPPSSLSSVVPIGILQTPSVIPYWSSQWSSANNLASPDRLVTPTTFVWKYEKPMLFYTAVGLLDVKALYEYQFIKEYEADGIRLKDVNIPGIEDHNNYDVLEQLLLGKFMQIIGYARGAFTFNEMPVISNADQLVRDGTDKYKNARKELYQRHDWWRAIRA